MSKKDIMICVSCGKKKPLRSGTNISEKTKIKKRFKEGECSDCAKFYPRDYFKPKGLRWDYEPPKEYSGVYAIECKITKTVYVGCSANIYQRLISHRAAIRSGSHTIRQFKEDSIKYGLDNFTFKIISFYPKDELRTQEDILCLEYISMGWSLYNINVTNKSVSLSVPSSMFSTLRELAISIYNGYVDIQDVEDLITQRKKSKNKVA